MLWWFSLQQPWMRIENRRRPVARRQACPKPVPWLLPVCFLRHIFSRSEYHVMGQGCHVSGFCIYSVSGFCNGKPIMDQTLKQRIRTRVSRTKKTDVFIPRDFADLSGDDQVLRALRALVRMAHSYAWAMVSMPGPYGHGCRGGLWSPVQTGFTVLPSRP